ncbi:MAG: c-type cytochrome [Ghiorsea sp.]|nr:c-type cytochrome [Ghiorsea sp.]
MKIITLWVVLISLAACSQEQVPEVKSPVATPQSTNKSLVAEEVGDTAKPNMDAKQVETTIEVQVNKSMEISKAEQPEVKVAPKEVAPKEEVQTKEVVIEEQDTLAGNQEEIAPTAVPAKVIAPPTQGKGEIRSEPKNPPKQGLMLKTSRGDAISGKKVAKKCMSCHTFNQGGKKKTGPNLFGIMGQAKGSVDGYKYGTYLKDVGGVWDENSLRTWIADSKGVAKKAGKKTKMSSQKINGKKSDDLIAYLETLQ